MITWTIYNRPDEFPEKEFVAEKGLIEKGIIYPTHTKYFASSQKELDAIKEKVAPDLEVNKRYGRGVLSIVESWV